MFRSLFVLLLFLFHCSSLIDNRALKGGQAQEKIKGFTQFDIAGDRDYIGYVLADGNQFLEKVWEGAPYNTSAVKQTIEIDVTESKSFAFGFDFTGILAGKKVETDGKVKNESVARIVLKLINPQEISIQNPLPSPLAKNRPDLLEKPYVSSVLKVDKITVQMLNQDGKELSGSVALSHLNVKTNGSFKSSTKAGSAFFAENAYVGYKLSNPPPNADQIKSFSGDVSALYKNQKRVAILPFAITSTNPEDELLYKDGLPETLEVALNKVESLNIVPGQNAKNILEEKGSSKLGPVVLGKRLNVQSVLQGSFKRIQNKILITCKLYNVAKGGLEKSFIIRPKSDDYDEVMEKVSYATLENFRIKATKKEKEAIERVTHATENSKAFSIYIQAQKKFALNDLFSIEEAIKLYKQAIKEDSSYALAYVGLAKSYRALFKYDKTYGVYSESRLELAEKYCRKAYDIDEKLSQANQCMSFVEKFIKKNLKKATNFIYKALEYDKNDASIYLSLFRLSPKVSRNSDNHYFRRALELGKSDIHINLAASQVFVREKSFKKAYAYANKALNLNPRRFRSITFLTKTFADAGRYKDALKFISKGERKYGRHTILEYNKGYVQYAGKKYQKAISYFEKSLKLYPQFLGCRLAIANSYSRLGDYPNAKRNYDILTQQSPTNPQVYRSYAYFELKVGKSEAKYKSLLQRSCKLGSKRSCNEFRKL
ncbi:MAG: tetratricopeptide repeat protein [Bacteroidota bacterium]